MAALRTSLKEKLLYDMIVLGAACNVEKKSGSQVLKHLCRLPTSWGTKWSISWYNRSVRECMTFSTSSKWTSARFVQILVASVHVVHIPVLQAQVCWMWSIWPLPLMQSHCTLPFVVQHFAITEANNVPGQRPRKRGSTEHLRKQHICSTSPSPAQDLLSSHWEKPLCLSMTVWTSPWTWDKPASSRKVAEECPVDCEACYLIFWAIRKGPFFFPLEGWGGKGERWEKQHIKKGINITFLIFPPKFT